jgi:hypothetical protein
VLMTTAIVLPVPLADCLAVSGPAAILCPYLCAVLILTASSLLCVTARANSLLSSCCSSDCRVGAGLVMTSGGLPYISKPASRWRHLPRPGEACC